MTAPSYKFHLSIIDEQSGETVIADYCSLTEIAANGACESVDMHVASTLRAFQRNAREQYERREYQTEAV